MSHALPYDSQAKGLIERSHQTCGLSCERLPSYIGKDMDPEASNKIFKLPVAKSNRLVFLKARLSWADFLNYAAQVVVDYNNKPHSSLKRITYPGDFKKTPFKSVRGME